MHGETVKNDADALKYVRVLTLYDIYIYIYIYIYVYVCVCVCVCCARFGLDNKLLISTSAVSQNQ
jgi:hypothetical protein